MLLKIYIQVYPLCQLIHPFLSPPPRCILISPITFHLHDPPINCSNCAVTFALHRSLARARVRETYRVAHILTFFTRARIIVDSRGPLYNVYKQTRNTLVVYFFRCRYTYYHHRRRRHYHHRRRRSSEWKIYAWRLFFSRRRKAFRKL